MGNAEAMRPRSRLARFGLTLADWTAAVLVSIALASWLPAFFMTVVALVLPPPAPDLSSDSPAYELLVLAWQALQLSPLLLVVDTTLLVLVLRTGDRSRRR